ncbi:sialate O-acetylesterase [Rubinisphaera margarita]|uniref:sialate O-acetylesterase n=1 Tax=Rubinisphaera margarita TaxID=2909586 RepID=UPI001EE8B324|nr:sialate O-acetylesterase [Rubinisphaera margarita]MCG6157289.1 sialate O-acetylesterase [Rubinisphaera margarita]
MRRLYTFVGLCLLSLAIPSMSRADVELPNVFTDHMVLQRNQENPVWGWDEPGTEVQVSIAGQSHSAKAGKDGRWEVKLDALSAGGPHTLKVAGSSEEEIKDVLVGEVWVCSGQSNMAWNVGSANDPDLEQLTANYPQIRLLSVPNRASQESEKNFDGSWVVCSPDTVKDFSAVGYFFGRQLHQTLDVPIGLIDNAWGGSAAEAWIRRDVIEKDERFSDLLAQWKQTEENYDHEATMARFQESLNKWEEAAKKAKADGKSPPSRPRSPRDPLAGNHRPGNLYGGCLHPIVGYGIKGAIWYQGESNAGRAYQYRDLFPLMIEHWRNVWNQGDFSFYWVSLADYRRETESPTDSSWAELREAQTMTLALPNTGEAIITDLGEADDIHPRNKQDVAKRLARLALKHDYDYDIVAGSPRYESHEINDGKVTVTFTNVGTQLDTFDVREPIGFTIAGEDRVFVPAEAKVVSGNKIEVWSSNVQKPVAVRYAWADNPVCNVQNTLGQPLTPFRTDDWEGITAQVKK